jgi:hypothetical protein
MVLRLSGEAGQVSLALTADSASARASVDQHAAEIWDALAARGRPVTCSALLSYAQGFTEAAIGRGWWPPHRRAALERDSTARDGGTRRDGDDFHDASPLESAETSLDWESLRLAAICRLFIEAQGLGI